IRRESTSTTAPKAPLTRSFHMKPKRSCPGVPKMYMTSDSSTATRPKSIATVVVVLVATCPRLSTDSPTVVIAASVVNGVMSEIAPTNVVLPTPKPPATTILTGTGAGDVALGAVSESTNTFDQSRDEVDVLGDTETREKCLQQTVDDQIGCHHADDTERQLQSGGQLGNRKDLRPAEMHDRGALERQGARVRAVGRDLEHRFDLEMDRALRAPAGDRIGPHDRCLRRRRLVDGDRLFGGRHGAQEERANQCRFGLLLVHCRVTP